MIILFSAWKMALVEQIALTRAGKCECGSMAENSAQSLLNWQRLYEWTEAQEPGAVLGESCTNSSCPLAKYLNEQTGRYWSVGPSIRLADGFVKDHLHKPEWVKALIEQTDEATGNEQGPVTREQHLSILEQVKDLVEPYTPTLGDEALYLTLLTSQVCLSVQNEYGAGNFADLETYNRMYAVARRVDVQARKLFDLLEQSGSEE
jgi:hypothetical protein